MKIVLIEGFYNGSHKQWADGVKKHSSHDITILSLPGRHWKWRMHGGAISLAKQFNKLDFTPDLIVVTDMIDVALFKSLTEKRRKNVPLVLYFHENQLTYPWSPADQDISLKRDMHYSFINYSSALCADYILFNSQYHMHSFIDSLPEFLRTFPDFNELHKVEIIRNKSNVLHIGMDLKKFDTTERKITNNVPHILWNHRWEYDKNPDDFFNVLFRLHDEGVDFKLILLGEQYKKVPQIFKKAQKQLADTIVHIGWVPSFSEYAACMHKADILPVTNIQDFFGISIMEAVYCGVVPLLPDRLTYPELFSKKTFEKLFYKNSQELYEKLKSTLLNVEQMEPYKMALKSTVSIYSWQNIIKIYDTTFENFSKT